MKRRGLILSLAAVLVLGLSAAGLAIGPGIVGHMGWGWGGGGMQGRGWGGGPGMTGGMMGPGMMGQGFAGGFEGHPCAAYGSFASEKEITKDTVASMAEAYLDRLGNPNLKLGEVKELEDAFEVTIVTKDNSLVNKYQVSKKTGFTTPVN